MIHRGESCYYACFPLDTHDMVSQSLPLFGDSLFSTTWDHDTRKSGIEYIAMEAWCLCIVRSSFCQWYILVVSQSVSMGNGYSSSPAALR